MAKASRALLRRIRTVQNTRRITKTMELVSASKLKRATDRVAAARPYAEALREVLGDLVTPDLVELRNLVEVAGLIVRSAMARKESRGLHYTLDYPDMLPKAADTVLVPAA